MLSPLVFLQQTKYYQSFRDNRSSFKVHPVTLMCPPTILVTRPALSNYAATKEHRRLSRVACQIEQGAARLGVAAGRVHSFPGTEKPQRRLSAHHRPYRAAFRSLRVLGLAAAGALGFVGL